MTRQEIATMIEAMATEIGCEFAYHHFEEGQNPTLPFIVFQYPSSDDVFADDLDYVGKERLNIYLCSEQPNFEAEETIKYILATNRIADVMTRDYIKEEHMFQTLFESEVIING